MCLWELEREGGFEEYLKYLKGALARLLFKFCSGTHEWDFEELGSHAKEVGPRNVLVVELVRSLSSMFFFECISCDSPRQTFWTT